MPNHRDRLIKAYYGEDNDIIIVGVADNCYIYWFSVTKMDDAETNRMILEWLNIYIIKEKPLRYIMGGTRME